MAQGFQSNHKPNRQQAHCDSYLLLCNKCHKCQWCETPTIFSFSWFLRVRNPGVAQLVVLAWSLSCDCRQMVPEAGSSLSLHCSQASELGQRDLDSCSSSSNFYVVFLFDLCSGSFRRTRFLQDAPGACPKESKWNPIAFLAQPWKSCRDPLPHSVHQKQVTQCCLHSREEGNLDATF